MSTAPNLNLISEVMPVNRRDFALTDVTLLNPNNANPLVDGEWLEMDTGYTLKRGSGETTSAAAWPVFSLRGQYDTQAIGKATVLFHGGWEATSAIVNAAGAAVGSFLVVNAVTIGGLAKRGLAVAAGAGQHMVQGIITKLPGGGVLQFLHTAPFQITI